MVWSWHCNLEAARGTVVKIWFRIPRKTAEARFGSYLTQKTCSKIHFISSMEKERKNRGKIFLTIAVTVNILFSVVSIGFLIYKVRSLEEQVFQLQKDSSKTGQTRERQNEAWDDLAHRRKRAAESLGESKSCTTCHNACVKLFGLGASAKVSAIKLSWLKRSRHSRVRRLPKSI